MASRSPERVILAAGAVVWRRAPNGPGLEVLVVHRPRYDDWSFPKGKRDRGEELPVTAVREVAEETGVSIRLGLPLMTVTYRVSRGHKTVHYWVGHVVDEGSFAPDDEVDEIRWVGLETVAEILTYDFDLDVLKSFREVQALKAHKTRTLVVLRHATARSRKAWRRDDHARPLTKPGQFRADKISGVLDAYGVREIVSSDAVRCLQTVEPYAQAAGRPVRGDTRLTEEATGKQVRRAVEDLVALKRPVVACSHRPTLPTLFAALGLSNPELKPGEAIVVHHRAGTVFATEHLTT